MATPELWNDRHPVPGRPRLRLAHGVREAWAAGYGWARLLGDVRAGMVVALVAVPLSMALAMAAGLAPEAGLWSAGVGGVLAALLGGSRVQVSGPTAAYVVVLAPIVNEHGPAGLAVVTFVAGLVLVAMGCARMGRLIQYVPYPVTIGFTAGIGAVVATFQVNDFLGLGLDVPPHIFDKIVLIAQHAGDVRWNELAMGVGTLAVLVLWPRLVRAVPAPLVALSVASVAGLVLAQWFPDAAVRTVGSRFEGGLSSALPAFAWPGWGASTDALSLDRETVAELLRAGFAVAMLGAISSLLSAVVSDGLSGFRHDPDGELVAQGVANTALACIGAVPCSGAVARTVTNVRFGARSPVAALVQSAAVLAALLIAAPLLELLPLAALAALLLVVAWNMSEVRHLPRILRQGPRADAVVLVVVFATTVAVDMASGVAVGLVLASLLFMRRMIEVSGVRLLSAGHPEETVDVPPGVLHYEVTGPLFFGAVHKATGLLERSGQGGAVVLLDLRAVPAIDATALVNLRGALERCLARGTRVIVAGLQPQPAHALARAALQPVRNKLAIERSFDAGLELARLWTKAT